MTQNNTYPVVSIVIPCFNEEQFIGNCLDSILANDYPKDRLEIVVADGRSEDKTRHILEEYARCFPFIRVLDNLKREQQLGLNIAITDAKGEIVMRMDAHSTYKNNYIIECVKALQSYPADNVGGRWITVPRDRDLIGKAICFATSTPFGVGNAYYRLTSLKAPIPSLNHPKWEINVAYFCCRREVFDKIGLFNEKLDRSEDIDFRARLKKAGMRTLFVPTIECYYSMRTKYWGFIKHMFRNGLWVLLPLNHAPNISFSLRHIVPLLFFLSLLISGIGAFFYPAVWPLFLLVIGSHTILSLYYSLRISIREKRPSLFFILPFIFISLHIAYGVGSFVALFYLAKQWGARFFKFLKASQVKSHA